VVGCSSDRYRLVSRSGVARDPGERPAAGLTTLRARLRNVRGRRTVEEELLVDSGAFYTVVPGRTLRRLGIRPRGTERFYLADGTGITRQVGIAHFEVGGRKGVANVIFGRRGDAPLLGALTLEALGLILDPLRRKLRPARLLLA
jgi:predicted aspartyl protease